MKTISLIALASCFLISLSACAPINTEFGCDLTAGDSCLDVGEADNLSKQGLSLETLKNRHNTPSQIVPIDASHFASPRETEQVWIAPYTDSKGNVHSGSFVTVSLHETKPKQTNTWEAPQ